LEQFTWSRTQRTIVIVLLFMVIGLIGVYLWLPEDSGTSTEGTIGVIEVYGVIDDSYYAYILSSAVEEALMDDNVKAVVIEIDSPGGSAYLIEQVYLDLLELKKEKPLVASISMALSGGYYIAVSADHIFSLPSSMVGNVGVVGTGPGWLIPSESMLETGPNKLTGFSPESFPFDLTSVLECFSEAVEAGRGDELKIPMSTVTRGTIWLGVDAKKFGLVDEMGSFQTAIEYAAELAHITEYQVESMVARVANSTEAIQVRYPSLQELNEKNPPPAVYYLYIPANLLEQSSPPQNTTISLNVSNVSGDVMVDLSHGNTVSPWVLDTLTRLLTEKGLFVGYSSDWEKIEDGLNETRALVIACPSVYYSDEEYQKINSWVINGGTLILLGDASYEFLTPGNLQAPLNSLSDHWGIHFGNGYLYNMENHYGFYRNIKIDNIRESFLTENVEELVFYTAIPVYSESRGYAKTSDTTYNSVSERAGEYDVLAIYQVGRERVIAFGDMTWLMEPYVYAGDNLQLLRNLVEAIASD